MVNRGCTVAMPDGRLCRSPALRGERFCRMHDPDGAETVAASRKLGGQRRRRESTLAGAYELGSIRTVDDLFRLVEIASYDLLAMDPSIARARAILHAAQVGSTLLKVGDLEARVEELERARDARVERDEIDLAGGLLGDAA